MKRLCLILLVYIGCESKTSIIQSGVSWDLAQNRKDSISDVRYKLNFDIPEDKIKEKIKKEGHSKKKEKRRKRNGNKSCFIWQTS